MSINKDDWKALQSQYPNPAYPGLISPVNGDGSLKSQYNVTAAGPVGYNRKPLDAIEGEAMAPGDSQWAQLAKQQNETAGAHAVDQAGVTAARGAETAGDNLAMKGGVSSAQRERLATAGGNAALTAGQDARAKTASNDLGIDQQDQTMKNQLLGTAMTGEGNVSQLGLANDAQANQVNEFNSTNALTGLSTMNQQQLDKYKTEMGTNAANINAYATANSGKK